MEKLGLKKKQGRVTETMSENKNQHQNTGTYDPQDRMSEPPQVITSKDLAYLKDAMSWELLAFKKCRQSASFATDPEVQHQIDSAGRMHQKHYDQLLNYLQSNPNQDYLQ
jgi:hypothetical protein